MRLRNAAAEVAAITVARKNDLYKVRPRREARRAWICDQRGPRGWGVLAG